MKKLLLLFLSVGSIAFSVVPEHCMLKNLTPSNANNKFPSWLAYDIKYPQSLNNQSPDCKLTTMMLGAFLGKIGGMRKLFSLSIAPNLELKDSEGNTALFYASAGGQAAVTCYLLYKGADATVKNKDGKTAADVASSGAGLTPVEKAVGVDIQKIIAEADKIKGNARAVQTLCPKGLAADLGIAPARPSVSCALENLTPANANSKFPSWLAYDIKYPQSLNNQSPDCKLTTMMLGAFLGKIGGMRKLFSLSIAPNLELKDSDHNTALFYASAGGQAAATCYLLYKGADATVKNKDGKTAADVASSGAGLTPVEKAVGVDIQKIIAEADKIKGNARAVQTLCPKGLAADLALGISQETCDKRCKKETGTKGVILDNGKCICQSFKTDCENYCGDNYGVAPISLKPCICTSSKEACSNKCKTYGGLFTSHEWFCKDDNKFYSSKPTQCQNFSRVCLCQKKDTNYCDAKCKHDGGVYNYGRIGFNLKTGKPVHDGRCLCWKKDIDDFCEQSWCNPNHPGFEKWRGAGSQKACIKSCKRQPHIYKHFGVTPPPPPSQCSINCKNEWGNGKVYSENPCICESDYNNFVGPDGYTLKSLRECSKQCNGSFNVEVPKPCQCLPGVDPASYRKTLRKQLLAKRKN